MKQILLFVFLFISTSIFAQDFVTVWFVGNDSNSIEFEATTTGSVDYTWESNETNASGSGSFQGPNVTISGLTSGDEITLHIEPDNFKSFKATNVPFFTPYALLSVEQWGAVEWETLEEAFVQSASFEFSVNTTDVPDLSNCISLRRMFAGLSNLNSPFNINF